MNFLQLVNRTRQECAASGAALATLQAGLNNEGQRFKDWVNQAWREIQLHKPDWLWMRKNFSFNTVVNQTEYTKAQANVSDLGEWVRDSLRSYTLSAGTVDEQILPFLEWMTYRNVYQFGGMRVATGKPAVFTVKPDKSIAIGPLPYDVFAITGEYYRAPAPLVNDTDDPSDAAFGLPQEYDMLIVYKAMQSYATFYNAPEVLTRANDGVNDLLGKLEFEYLPTLISGPPLA